MRSVLRPKSPEHLIDSPKGEWKTQSYPDFASDIAVLEFIEVERVGRSLISAVLCFCVGLSSVLPAHKRSPEMRLSRD
jgi:hypothetical protein